MRTLSHSLRLMTLCAFSACGSDDQTQLTLEDTQQGPDLHDTVAPTDSDSAQPDLPDTGSDSDTSEDTTSDVDSSAPDTAEPDIPDVDVPDVPAGDECTTHNDCAPALCQLGRCDNGFCILVPEDDGTPCSDGNLCTGPDLCVSGTCRGVLKDCDDGNPCTTDSCQEDGSCAHLPVVCEPSNTCQEAACDIATGACVETPLEDGVSCDDAKGCTLHDTCLSGECRGVAVACGDGDPCTLDDCTGDSLNDCVNTPLESCTIDAQCADQAEGVACDDQDPNSVADMCLSGRCAGFTLHRSALFTSSHSIHQLIPHAQGWSAILSAAGNNQLFQSLIDATHADALALEEDTFLPGSHYYISPLANLFLTSGGRAFKKTSQGIEPDPDWTALLESHEVSNLKVAYHVQSPMSLEPSATQLWLGWEDAEGQTLQFCSLADGCIRMSVGQNWALPEAAAWWGLIGWPTCEGAPCERGTVLSIFEERSDTRESHYFYYNRANTLIRSLALHAITQLNVPLELNGQPWFLLVHPANSLMLFNATNATESVHLDGQRFPTTQVLTSIEVGPNYLLATGYHQGEGTTEPFIMVGPLSEEAVKTSSWIHHSLGVFPNLPATPMGPKHLAIHPLTGEIRMGGALRLDSVNFPEAYQGAIWTRL